MTTREFLDKNGYSLSALSRLAEMCSECSALIDADEDCEIERLFELLSNEAAKP